MACFYYCKFHKGESLKWIKTKEPVEKQWWSAIGVWEQWRSVIGGWEQLIIYLSWVLHWVQKLGLISRHHLTDFPGQPPTFPRVIIRVEHEHILIPFSDLQQWIWTQQCSLWTGSWGPGNRTSPVKVPSPPSLLSTTMRRCISLTWDNQSSTSCKPCSRFH